MDHNTYLVVQKYWLSYLDTFPPGSGKAPERFQAWSFGNTPEMADELGRLVREGVKIATASLLWWYEEHEEPHPEVGDYCVILDSEDRPLCIIRVTDLSAAPFNEVDEDHAVQEGEGDRSLSHGRTVHWEFFAAECNELGKEPYEQMPVVCEKFRLVYPQKE